MNLSFVLAVVLSTSVLITAQNRPASFQRRQLWPYESVCNGTSAPTAYIISTPYPPPPTPKYGPTPRYPSGPSSSSKSPPGSSSGSSSSKGPPGSSSSSSKSSSHGSGSGPKRSSSASHGSLSRKPPRSSSGSKANCPPPPRNSGGYRSLRNMATSFLFGSSSSSHEETSTTATNNKKEAAVIVDEKRNTQRKLQTTISLETTLKPYDGYSLSGSFTGTAILTWPNLCFSASLQLTNFISNCQNCNFVVISSADTCSSIQSVVPFVDPTEVDYIQYNNLTLFSTDSSGNANVNVPVICTGTGPVDNHNRPLILLDSTGTVAACGILNYICQ